MSVPNGLTIKNNIYDMNIGDCIPFRYTVSASGAIGNISEIGTCNMAEIPVAGSATPNGLAYFIKVDKGLLICDRVVQHSVTWDTLNNNGYIEGKSMYCVNKVQAGSGDHTMYIDEEYLYAANSSSNTVTRIKLLDNSTMTITTGESPSIIGNSPTHIYVLCTNTIVCINRLDNTTIDIPINEAIASFWSDSNNIYLSAVYSHNVICIKLSDNSIVKIPSCQYPQFIWGDATHVYVGATYGSTVTCIKRSDNTTTDISTGTRIVGIWGDSNNVYVLCFDSKCVSCINRLDNSVINISNIGSNAAYSLWGDATNVYVGNTSAAPGIACIKRSNNTSAIISTLGVNGMYWGDVNNVYMCSSSSVICINRINNTVVNIPISNAGNVASICGDENYVYCVTYYKDLICIKRSNNTFIRISGFGDVGIQLRNNVLYSSESSYISMYKLNSKSHIIRSLTGGNSYLGSDGKASSTDNNLGIFPTNNEWDKYIVNSDLNGKITPGDNNIWHIGTNIPSSWMINTLITNNSRTARPYMPYVSINKLNWAPSSTVLTTIGFRPVLQYVESGSKQTNLWY